MNLKTKYNGCLTLGFLEGFEYQKNLNFDDEKALNAQGEAQDKLQSFCDRNNIELSYNLWESDTDLDNGYTESLDFAMITDIPIEEIFSHGVFNELESLREDIEYCRNIDIDEAEILNFNEIVEKTKKQLLNKTMTINGMVEIMDAILEYKNDGDIENNKCSWEDNSYGFEYLGEFIPADTYVIDILWDVINTNDNLYDRVIKIIDIRRMWE